MRIRLPKGQRKTDCSICGHPLEPELVGKQSHCRECRRSYMRDYRQKTKELILQLKEFYNQHSVHG